MMVCCREKLGDADMVGIGEDCNFVTCHKINNCVMEAKNTKAGRVDKK